MTHQISDLTSQSLGADTVKEGLPFWTLWLLLSIILLLVLFIFLRDKNLRMRLSFFLSRAKRRMLRLRLRIKIKKETQKKTGVWKEIGQKAWSEDIRIEQTAQVCKELSQLEDLMNESQMRWHEIYSRIEALEKEVETGHRNKALLLDGEKSIKEPFEARIAQIKNREFEIENQLAKAETEKREASPGLKDEKLRLRNEREALQAELDLRRRKGREKEGQYEEEIQAKIKEIKSWEKSRAKVQAKILEIKKAKDPLFERMGKILDEIRFGHDELTFHYFQIDGINQIIKDLESRLEKVQ